MKTRIELFEEELITGELTDEKLQKYEKLLRRSGDDWCRIQHCFITAYNFPVERVADSVRLIEFGNAKYGSDKPYIVCSNEMLGTIYERAGLYQQAYELYLSIYPNIGGWKGRFPWCLLDTKMHTDNFAYSPELEEYIGLCQNENIISKSFIQNKFILTLAEYIVADYHRDSDKKLESYNVICEMIEPGYRGPLYEKLIKHRYDEHLRISSSCKSFLEGL